MAAGRSRRHRVAAGALCAVLLAILLVGKLNSSHSTGKVSVGHVPGRIAHDPSRAANAKLQAREIGTLPEPLQDAAAAPLDSARLVLLGGLEGNDTSTAAVTVLAGGRVGDTAHLPEAQHDAQAVNLGGEVYVFGGGQVTSFDHILRYDPASGRTSVVGRLPQAASDVAAAAIGGTAYIVGGYNGHEALDTILAWRPGANATIAGHLPSALRYAAVAAAGSKLIIAGGSTADAASRAILSFDPSTGRLVAIGELPHPLTHASAANLSPEVYVIGGRGSSPESQTSAILAIDPSSGRVRHAGRLAHPLSDAAVATVGGSIVVAGGRSPTGTHSSIFELTPALG